MQKTVTKSESRKSSSAAIEGELPCAEPSAAKSTYIPMSMRPSIV